ncbi:MAG: VOC family protein [Blastomonas sp.]
MHGLSIDHATIRTARLADTIAFYQAFLGFSVGWRPSLTNSGAWLYAQGGDAPILHLIETPEDVGQGGMFDHIAFRGTGLLRYLDRLKAADVAFLARPVPETRLTQVHHFDPNGVKIEVAFEEQVDADLLRCDLPYPAA